MKNNYLSSSFNSVHSLYIDPSWAGKSLDFSQMYFKQYNKVTQKATDTIWLSPVHGKVRQLFQERRVCKGVGVDKSYPLQPLNQNRKASKSLNRLSEEKGVRSSSEDLIKTSFLHRKLPNLGPSLKMNSDNKRMSHIPQAKSSFNTPGTPVKTSTVAGGIRQIAITTPTRVGSAGASFNRNPILKPRGLKTPEMGRRTATPVVTRVTVEGTTFNPFQGLQASWKTVPISGNIQKSKILSLEIPRRRATSQRSTSLAIVEKESRPLVKNQNGASKASTSTSGKVAEAMSPPKSATPKPAPPHTPLPNCSLPQCKICGRHFNMDRLEVHEKVCGNLLARKRAKFDAVQHRLGGTEAEKFYKKEFFNRAQSPIVGKKPDWRQKHEELLVNVRAARKVQDHLAKGGKLSDLPPPTPSENPDYVSCPHCSRKFNEAAAERHIPRCANMRHNKPNNPGRTRPAAPQKK